MSKRTLTIYTCDRCGKQREYEHHDGANELFGPEPFDDEEFVPYQAATVTPLSFHYPRPPGESGHACLDCLTTDERESLSTQRQGRS